MPDKDKEKVEVRTFNWGPCLIHLQIKDDFKKILLDEAAKNEKDFSSKLAGQIRKETGYLKIFPIRDNNSASQSNIA